MTTVPQHVTDSIGRRRVLVRGQVQGVGFRPFVYRMAADMGLLGWVCNCGAGVEIELQGDELRIASFIARLRSEAPPRARIVSVEQASIPLAVEPSPFHMARSGADPVRTAIPADTAICNECLNELFDPGDRRYRYPFINCVHCGPRFTISRGLPFDRHNTSMAGFRHCPECEREYGDPLQRRFHAQTNACPRCGPQLSFHNHEGVVINDVDAVSATLTAIRGGHIVALKGIGGFHLLCDARNPTVVARLRTAKGRAAKPFAVMVANVSSLFGYASCDAEQQHVLESPARPIVLLNKTVDCDVLLAGVAPDSAHLGVLLPYTPLHYLVFHEAAERPAGNAWLQEAQPLILICTSANRGGEPLVIHNHEAFDFLKGVADFFVTHDRAITQRCDDSVIKTGVGSPYFIRRARGYVPHAIKLPRSGPSQLALGGDLKNTFCITRGDEAYVSQHNGDLDNGAACRNLADTLELWIGTLDIQPEYVVHDRHPDFFSSRLAQGFAAERGLPCLAVQHHHAHIAAVMAEQGLDRPALGLALDGFGQGDDGDLWGGELLRVEENQYRRLGHLYELALPGGDRAAREPWRMAASVLHDLDRVEEINRRFSFPAVDTVRQMLEGKVQAPRTSSAGRWFDAAAGLLGVVMHTSYEGQAAMHLEALAVRHGAVTASRDDYCITADGVLNLMPLLDRLAYERDAAYGAALFHATLAAALSEWVRWIAEREPLYDVVMSGGCFMNAVLRRLVRTELGKAGFTVHVAQQLPSNDGGLSLGQAWVGIGMVTTSRTSYD